VRQPPRPYAPVPLTVLSRRDLDASDKITLAALLLRANEDGHWRGTNSALAELLGENEKRVSRSLANLQRSGYLKKRRIRWGTSFSLNTTGMHSVQSGGFVPARIDLNEKAHSGQERQFIPAKSDQSFRPESTGSIYQEPIQEPSQESTERSRAVKERGERDLLPPTPLKRDASYEAEDPETTRRENTKLYRLLDRMADKMTLPG
jgi:hypothetical protein